MASEIICLPERPPGVNSENVTVIVSAYHDSEASKSPVRFELTVKTVDNFVSADGAWSVNETISRGTSYVWIFKPEAELVS